MSDINFPHTARILSRCAEIAIEPNMKAAVVSAHNDVLEPHADPYLVKHKAVVRAATAFAKENAESIKALNALDAPYLTARAAIAARLPETVLPGTLKTRPTDTDKIDAIEDLIDLIDDHVGTAWADELLAGDFGTKAPTTVREIRERIAADKNLSTAQNERAAAFGATYTALLAFKRVVRAALGSKSKQYRRIHQRASAAETEEEEVTEPTNT